MKNLSCVFETKSDLQVVFQSVGCQWQKDGACTMCAYGRADRNLTPDEVAAYFDAAIERMTTEQQVLILDCFGSILDEREFPAENLEILLGRIARTKFHMVIFETRYETIDAGKIHKIQSALGGKQITFEFGLESASAASRSKINKYIDDVGFWDTVRLVRQLGCHMVVNLLLGIPGMTSDEQVQDCVKSIEVCTENGVDEIVLFLVNVKEDTPLYELYRTGAYRPVSHWQLIEVLRGVSSGALGRLWLAWYGNKGNGVKPVCCGVCKDDLDRFYAEFLKDFDAGRRRELILRLFAKYQANPCECF